MSNANLSSDDLKPCPFCGGEAMTCFDDERMIFRHSVECIACGGRSCWYSTKDVAAAAWNARAAVTDEQFSLAVHDGRAWQVIRECHMEYDEDNSNDELYPTEAYRCSLCGLITLEGRPEFCPNCGAKVVG